MRVGSSQTSSSSDVSVGKEGSREGLLERSVFFEEGGEGTRVGGLEGKGDEAVARKKEQAAQWRQASRPEAGILDSTPSTLTREGMADSSSSRLKGSIHSNQLDIEFLRAPSRLQHVFKTATKFHEIHTNCNE